MISRLRAHQTISELAAFTDRGPGTDAERRAALWLAKQLRSGRRRVSIEPFWCRPNWALAQAWHVALALAGSLLSVPAPGVGLALLALALVSMLADGLFGASPGRWLTPERASQNVIAASEPADAGDTRRRLVIVANYDAGRSGLIYSFPFSSARRRFARAAGGRLPGWLGWLVLITAWLCVAAVLRGAGEQTSLLRTLQFIATAGLVVALALLLEAARAPYTPAAADNASGTAVALDLARALEVSPPANLRTELVLTGSHEGGAIGLRRHLRAHRSELRRANTIVLGLAPCGSGRPRWWLSDGPLLPAGSSPALRRLCAELAERHSELGARPHRGRGQTPVAAAGRGLPAIAIGALDDRGRVPHSHQPSDTPATIDAETPERVLEFALLLVDAIDAQPAGQQVDRRPGDRDASAIPA